MTVKKALITSAGFGTRFLPISKTIQKEMLPILNRPLIDYVVEDCIKAGIQEIVFVTNEHNFQVQHYYSENLRLYKYLEKMGKLNQYDQVAHLHSQATFTFIKQSDEEQYGTAVPVKLARQQLQNEDAFLVFMGDDFIYNTDGTSEAAAMIQLFQNSGSHGLATCILKPDDILHKYGIAEIQERNGYQYLTNLVEKPAPGATPSNLANISKYIFTPEIFDIIESQALDSQSGELYITDSITTLAQHAPVAIHTPQGEYLDGGYVEGWLKANLTVAKNHPQIWADISSYLSLETK